MKKDCGRINFKMVEGGVFVDLWNHVQLSRISVYESCYYEETFQFYEMLNENSFSRVLNQLTVQLIEILKENH